jgi:hypothetical protein
LHVNVRSSEGIEERQTPITMDFPGEAAVNRVLGGIWGSDLQ